MKEINITLNGNNDIIELVNQAENSFEARLNEAAEKVVNSGVSCILLSGPTCAGKTTTAQKIISEFTKIGKDVTVISIDDFFKDVRDTRVVNKDKKIDYDSVDVIDLVELKKCIESIGVGNIINVPTFDFLTQSRTGYKQHKIGENTVIIFEGIQAVYPEITALFKQEYIGIFIDVCEDVKINGEVFKKEEIRLIRRIVRDRRFRGASADFTFYLWESVRENEEKSIYPNKDICKVMLDSFLEHEIFLMKSYIKEALSELPSDSHYLNEGELLLKKFDRIQEISYDYIPENSLYTEFLGKK
ncbi:MAG: Flp pilus assembly complex ATPase component TadA [Clostridia bacterium]|nr:Flp pilus assembly complex ATPase component TadA [Clostridia bacterium]